MEDCLFCKIINKEIPKEFAFESENIVAFPDINPSADIHILIIPKKHIGGMTELGNSNGGLLSEIYSVVSKLVAENNLEDNFYRVVVNGGKAQHVPHLHFHLLGGTLKKMV